MSRLSVSIVVFRSDLDLLAQVVSALGAACRFATASGLESCDLDIVDNDSGGRDRDALAAIVAAADAGAIRATLVRSTVNGGYGAGNNLSIRRHASLDLHLVLNPDVLLAEDALAAALRYFASNPDVGLVTPQVRGFDGSLQYLCKRHPTLLDMFLRSVGLASLNRLFARRLGLLEMRDQDYRQTIRPIPYPTGCFMLFRHSVLAILRGFDEGYFLHYEDADIGRQVEQVSQTAYVPDVLVHHKWTRGSHRHWRMRWITICSGLRYWRKWGGVW